jgi:hypothetical protein
VTRFTTQSCAKGSLHLCAHLFTARSAHISFSRRGGCAHPGISVGLCFYRCCGSVFLPSIFVPVHRSFSGSGIPQSAWPQPNFLQQSLLPVPGTHFARSLQNSVRIFTGGSRYHSRVVGSKDTSFCSARCAFVWFLKLATRCSVKCGL